MSKCLAIHVRRAAVSILAPLQLGVGVRGGCEAIVHAASQAMSSVDDDRCWTLLLDFSNAFNSINREAMFVEFRRRLPGLSAWIEYCYSGQPLLHLGKDVIHSCSGVQQGDPLGPLGFALTLHPIIERIKAEVQSTTMNAWYLDDGTIMGPPDALTSALHIVERDGPSLGLNLNRAKSLLFVPSQCDASQSPLPPDIPIRRDGLCLLGCPIGPPSTCEEVLQARIHKIKGCLGVLHELGDAQMETTLLRSCLALPKLSYTLRTCPPSHITKATSEFDAAMRESLETILGGPISDWSWLKASLPSSRGGVNLRSAAKHAPAAFIASSAQSRGLVEKILAQPPDLSPHLDPAVSALATAASQPDWQQLEVIDVPLRQHHLSQAIDESVHQQLLSSASSPRDRALALSTTLPHAGDWLNCVPSSALGLHLQDREFRCCLRYWLGIPLHSGPYTCPECRHTADEHGDHQVGCGGNGDRITRHNAIRDVLFSAAQSAALAPSREAAGVVPDSLSRPADILLPVWSKGRPAALDVHVISPLQQHTLHEASHTPGHALNVGVQRKLSSHLASCRSAGVEFVPVVAETLGGLAEDTIRTVRAIGRAIAQRASSPSDTSTATTQLFRRLAISLWRGNACLWLHRQPPLPPTVDGII